MRANEFLFEHKKGVLAKKYNSKPRSPIDPSAEFAKQKTKVNTFSPVNEDPLEKIDILKQFANDAPAIPPKTAITATSATPKPVITTKITPKPVAKPATKPVKKTIALEPGGLGLHIEQAAKADGIHGAHLANFMAQSKVETANFTSLHEWASGDNYEGRLDLGNTQPGDGRRFKGRGFIHLTGRGDYTKCNKECGWEHTKTDIVKNPELVATNINVAVQSALWYWNKYIRKNYKPTSIVAVSTRVNGTNPNGLNARINAFKDYCAKLGIRIQGIAMPTKKRPTNVAYFDPEDPDAAMAGGDTPVAYDTTTINTDLA
jgi:putative chitinase